VADRIVVVGDALLDRDVDGPAERLAPDAPVPVIRQPVMRSRAGGAALAATFAARDGVDVTLVTALGDDDAGAEVGVLLAQEGVQVVDLVRRGRTPVKTRVRAAGHSLARIDDEDDDDRLVHPRPGATVIDDAAGVILVADYGRGVTRHPVLRRALAAATGRTAVVWDPHPRGSTPVAAVKLATPNRAEATRPGEAISGTGAAARAANRCCTSWRAQAVAVTLGGAGAVLGIPGRLPLAIPAPSTVAGDPCGAGDRFSSSAAVQLARGALVTEAVAHAVTCATGFVVDGGVGAMSAPAPCEQVCAGAGDRRREVTRAGGTVVATSGCFDLLHAGHVTMLSSARALGDHLVVLLNSDRSVQDLKGADRPIVPQADRAAVLRGLACVDEVEIFDEPTPSEALRRLRPDLFVKGDDYGSGNIPEEAVMRAWNGEVVVVPYLEGRSTSRLIEEVHRED
jgi:D-beta-D-heptose 7-phosphate kinase/D-beta-D-heptose 1-phosphate adenosyltransferase